jgi:formiminoglutamase
MRTPPDMSLWLGRDDTATEGPEALRLHQCIKPWTEDSPPGVCLLGFSCDEGVRRNQGRVGAAEGPRALRQALANLAWSKDQSLLDFGDVVCSDGKLEHAQEQLGSSIKTLLEQGRRPLVLGGGHETAWGSFLGLAEAFPETRIGIINLDAHFDLRESPFAHSGTPFRQIADWHRKRSRPLQYRCYGIAEPANTAPLFRTAEELGVVWRADWNLARWDRGQVVGDVMAFAGSVDVLYLSVDLDVLPGWIMPAVSAPAAFGVAIDTIETIVEQVATTGKLAVADVVEFNPAYDPDGLAARVAARLVWRLMRQWPLASEVQ